MGPTVRTVVVGIFLLAGAGSAGARTTTVLWGPIVIPPATAGPAHVDQLAGASGLRGALLGLFTSVASFPVTKPCSDCFITGVEPNLVVEDGQGNLVVANHSSMLMLHHVVVLNFSRLDVTCPPGFDDAINLLGLALGGNERWFAAGNERTALAFPRDHGYRVGSGDRWGLLYHLMNMMPEERTVYFQFTFTWTRKPSTQRTRPLWLDVEQCGDSEFATPAGYSDAHWDWRSDRSGEVVSILGHVHDFGISAAWQDVSAARNVFTSIAGYAAGSPFAPVGPGSGADASHPADFRTVASDPLGLETFEGHLADMTTGWPAARVEKGNLTRLHAQYNRPEPAGDDMGIMMAYLREDYCLGTYLCF